MPLEQLRRAVTATGLVLRGGFHPEPGDGVPGLPGGASVATLVLIGVTGRHGWQEFRRSAEFADAAPDPLDRWSRRVLEALAATLEAVALFPFGGPPRSTPRRSDC